MEYRCQTSSATACAGTLDGRLALHTSLQHHVKATPVTSDAGDGRRKGAGKAVPTLPTSDCPHTNRHCGLTSSTHRLGLFILLLLFLLLHSCTHTAVYGYQDDQHASAQYAAAASATRLAHLSLPSTLALERWRSLSRQRSSESCLPLLPLTLSNHRRQCCTPTTAAAAVTSSSSSSSSWHACTLIERCKRAMCNGSVPIACLADIGRLGAHTSFHNHPPFLTTVRQGGYGVAFGQTFSAQSKATASSSSSSSSSGNGSSHGRFDHGDAIATLSVTDGTVLEFNLDALRDAGNDPQRFTASVRAGGRHRHCARHHARLRLRLECKEDDDMVSSKNAISFSAAVGGGREKRMHLDVSKCKTVRLSAQLLAGSPMTFALRRSCYAVWKHTVLRAPRPARRCDLLCRDGKDIPLTCLGLWGEHGRNAPMATPPTPGLVTAAAGDRELYLDTVDGGSRISRSGSRSGGDGLVKVRYSATTSTATVAEAPASVPVEKADVSEYEDIQLELSNDHPTQLYKADIQTARRLGKRFDYLSGRLHLVTLVSSMVTNTACVPRDFLPITVEFRVLVNRQVLWSRRLVCKHGGDTNMRMVVHDIDEFAVNIWKVRSPRLVTLEAEMTRVPANPNCTCRFIAVFKMPKLKQLSEPPIFRPHCQDECIKRQRQGNGIVYLSCFLGAKGKKHAAVVAKATTKAHRPPTRFSCSKSITGRSNPFIAVATHSGYGRVGVDRAGAWAAKTQSVRLFDPEERNNYTDYRHAIGAHANSLITVKLTQFRQRGYIFNTFSAVLGLDILSGCEPRHLGSVAFEVWLDQKFSYKKVVRHAWASREINIDVANALELTLITRHAQDSPVLQTRARTANCRPSVWANARLQQMFGG